MSSSSPLFNPNYLQGSAISALSWVVYDVCLTLDREILAVWRAPWSVSKVLFLFSRYHTVLALGQVFVTHILGYSIILLRFFSMEAIGTKHFTLPLNINTQNIPLGSSFYAPCIANLKYSIASRWYIGLTEVFSILAGELLILIRMNAIYGWSRKMIVFTLFLFCAETVIGLVTTITSVSGGSKGLVGSTGILNCAPHQANVPDVNVAMWCTSIVVACIYLGLIINKAMDDVRGVDTEGQGVFSKFGFLVASRSSPMTPTLHLCLRDAAMYFLVVLGVLLVNLVLILTHNLYAQLGTPWLLATYSVASTRIFLNLKDLALHHYNDATWSEFQQDSAIEFQIQSGLRAGKELGRTLPELQPFRIPAAV